MASSYALPASAMTHSHGHGHLHAHSHSPSRQYSANTPRSLRQERSNGSLHSHSQSESHLDHDHSHSHRHAHSRERSPSPYLPNPPNSNGMPPIAAFEKQVYKPSPAPSQLGTFEPHLNSVNVIPHEHNHHSHAHPPPPPVEQPRSKITSFLLPFVLRWPLLHTILAEKDSRRIFYFMRQVGLPQNTVKLLIVSSLNFAFMVVQAFYGYLTDSLGLLSDSIHMFFDCLALGVGLFAAIASKWPPSERFPYGFGKIESLSGFGNGVFLM
jgi:zinc transporter 5/7